MIVETCELASFFRGLADEIERRGVDPESVCFIWERSLVEDNPIVDREGKLWANWKDGMRRKIQIYWRYLKEDIDDGNV